MVGFVIVSHSETLANGVVELTKMMADGVPIRAAGGQPNYTYEAFRCRDSLYKAFAFGDNSTQSWIPSRQSQWQNFDHYRAASDPVRARLMRIFCEDGRPSDQQDAERRLRRQASR